MKTFLQLAAIVAVGFCAVPAVAQQTGDLKIRFEYGGDPPKSVPIQITRDQEFCGKHDLKSQDLIVNPENKGIKNVIVQVYTGRGGSKIDDVEPANNTHTLANKNCRFEPHVVIAQVGDSLKVTNPDSVGHNANLQFFNNTQQNFTIPPGQEKTVKLEKDEPGAIPVACNIHPWMKALLVVLEHPYAAVSDENGDLTIKNIPVGKLVFRANHESGKLQEVTVGGKEADWGRRSTFEVDIKPGKNDFGTVVIPADAFN